MHDSLYLGNWQSLEEVCREQVSCAVLQMGGVAHHEYRRGAVAGTVTSANTRGSNMIMVLFHSDGTIEITRDRSGSWNN